MMQFNQTNNNQGNVNNAVPQTSSVIDKKTIKTELARLLLVDVKLPILQRVAHREGRIRGIVFALTGKDVGYGCGERDGVQQICEWLGWGFEPCGATGWLIDYDSDVDEDVLIKAGAIITPKAR